MPTYEDIVSSHQGSRGHKGNGPLQRAVAALKPGEFLEVGRPSSAYHLAKRIEDETIIAKSLNGVGYIVRIKA